MISKENIQYSLRNLNQRKSRSFMTILSIFIGVTTIFIFVSFGLGLFKYVNDLATGGSADKFLIYGKGVGAPGTGEVGFSEDDLDAVKSTRGVIEGIGYFSETVKVEQDSTVRYTFVAGGDPEELRLMFESFGIGIDRGRDLESGEVSKVTLGYNYHEPDKIFHKPLGINDKILINDEKFTIVGFYESVGSPPDDSQVYLTKEGFKKLFPDSENYSVLVGQASLKDLDATIDRVEKSLRKERNEEEGQETFFVSSFQDQVEAFGAVLGGISLFVFFIALISVVVSAVNTANTMVTSVLERVQEIGIIKSIGARNSEIFHIFLFESSFLGFIAGMIGVALGWLITAATGAILKTAGWGFLSPLVSPYVVIGGILFATLVGAISGVAPAVNAMRKKPVEALRYE
ncbi:MAG TPA: FtsX-like permease family protein [Candidatus Nanoarchaeia archaeon]|nr:FtsX-like permease family protein [Candidatus Nanoarchaeia archaeon]